MDGKMDDGGKSVEGCRQHYLTGHYFPFFRFTMIR